MAKWECLTEQEQAMVRGLGYEPGPMVVNRVGEGHWMFLDMKTRDELLVSTRPDGTLRATVEVAGITPPTRVMQNAECRMHEKTAAGNGSGDG